MIQIIPVTIDSVNLYLLDTGAYRLLVDSGFPGSIPALGRALRPHDIKVRDIDHVLVTHFHIDHAGAVQQLKDEGIQFILPDMQQDHIAAMEAMAAKWPYTTLRRDDNIVLTIDELRPFLTKNGIAAQAIPVAGHSPDSICLLLDSGDVFSGDMPRYGIAEASGPEALASWHMLKEKGATTVYPGHGDPYQL